MTSAFQADEIEHIVKGERWGLALTDVGGMVSEGSIMKLVRTHSVF
jgi:hypothetical protein